MGRRAPEAFSAYAGLRSVPDLGSVGCERGSGPGWRARRRDPASSWPGPVGEISARSSEATSVRRPTPGNCTTRSRSAPSLSRCSSPASGGSATPADDGVRLFPRSTAVLFVARGTPDGALAGFGTVRFRRDEHRRLVGRTGLYVLPDRRRSGVGRSIKQALLDHARALGATRAEAYLLEANLASAELNRQMGFRLRPAGPDDPAESGGHMIAEADLGPAAP